MTSPAETIAKASPAALGGALCKYLALTIALGHVDEIGRVRATNRQLREATGLSRSTVQRAMAALRRVGWLGDQEVLRLAPWTSVTASSAEPPGDAVWSPMETPGIARTWTLYPVIP